MNRRQQLNKLIREENKSEIWILEKYKMLKSLTCFLNHQIDYSKSVSALKVLKKFRLVAGKSGIKKTKENIPDRLSQWSHLDYENSEESSQLIHFSLQPKKELTYILRRSTASPSIRARHFWYLMKIENNLFETFSR